MRDIMQNHLIVFVINARLPHHVTEGPFLASIQLELSLMRIIWAMIDFLKDVDRANHCRYRSTKKSLKVPLPTDTGL